MYDIQNQILDDGLGAFIILQEDEEIGRMDFRINDDILVALHTEVSPKAEGQGIGKKLFLHMASFARENHMRVKAVCPFVKAQFKKNPGEYSDIMV